MLTHYAGDSAIQIKQAHSGHVALIERLSVDTFTETFAHLNSATDMQMYLDTAMTAAVLQNELDDPANIFYLAYYHNTPAGYAKIRGATPPEGLPAHNPLEIERLYILSSHKRKGIGNVLMKACLSYAEEHGYDSIMLGVWENNMPAIAFYKSWQFVPLGSHIFMLGTDPQTDIYMWRMVAG